MWVQISLSKIVLCKIIRVYNIVANDFFEYSVSVRKEKTFRILVYPNITYSKNLEQDSFVQVLKQQILLLNEIRDDLWFHIILPENVMSLDIDNVSQHYISIPTYPPLMRIHFNTTEILNVLTNEYDFDLVMSHLPEHTHQLKNTLYNKTNHRPKLFGYCHWWDFQSVSTWEGSFNQSILGLLEYDRCYINTQFQKNLVLAEMKETFSSSIIDRVDKILEVQYLGVNNADIITDKNRDSNKTIVFNHRPAEYKHFDEFIAITDKLYKQRQDFKVWVPLLDKKHREYVIVDSFGDEKQPYYNMLKTCRVGLSPKQTYGGWSIATTDGLMNGVPYIMFNELYYNELQSSADVFDTDEEILTLLNKYLDDDDYRNTKSDEAVMHIKENLIYKDEIQNMSDYMDDLRDELPKVNKEDGRIKDIIGWIKKSIDGITKKEIINKLGWGNSRPFTPYRTKLLENKNIFDCIGREPTYYWNEDGE